MAAAAGVTVTAQLMAAGPWDVSLDWTPAVHEALWDKVNKRPRLLHALVFDADDNLICPPLVLRRLAGDETGLTIGGVDPLWHLGVPGVGPAIFDREYVSGENKLSNGSFDSLDEDGTATYWRRISQDSRWEFEVGSARNTGGLDADDILEPDIDRFPTRPTDAYRLRITDLIGNGQFRARIVFEGRFDPPNLLTNGDFDLGPGNGWGTATNLVITPAVFFGGYYALRVNPIPKPQLISNGDFSAGSTGWTLPATFAVVTGGLIASPNVQPQYIADPHFETLAGWTDIFTPAPMSNDIDIIADGTHARTGTGVMRVGPITQHQVLANADFGAGFDNWFVSSTDAEPDPTWWTTDATEGNNGTACVRTIGWSTAGAGSGPLIKYLRADSVSGGGVEPYDVKPGESYRLEGYAKAAPGSEGQVYISVQFPHPTVPGHDTWILTDEIEGTEHSDMRWNVLSRDFTVPTNRFSVNVLVEIHNHGLGYWYFDTVTLTRTRGNRAQINCDTAISVIPDTRYVLSALIRSGDDMSGGNVRIGVILTGSGVDPLVIDQDKGNTDFEWTRMNVEVRPPAGYDTATLFVAGLDITGDSVWLDAMTFSKVENNSDVATHTSFAVIPDQRYQLSADVTSIGATRGTISIGVRLSGGGPDVDVEVTPSTLDDLQTKAVSIEVRPPAGYATATPYVRSTDVEGGVFAIDSIKLTKVDNNSDLIVHDAIAVTPERSYKWSQKFASDESLQRGTVQLVAKCTRSGFPDQTFVSSAMTPAPDGSFQTVELDFTPPSGYASVVCSIVATDVEGSNIFIDKGELRDTDGSTVVFDAVVTNPVGATVDVNATAPTGAEGVRCQLIAPAGTTRWIVGAASLARTDDTPATGNVVIPDLLTHPRTHAPLSVAAGTIDCPEVIPSDWHIVNMNNREALDHYCTVVSDPPREYRMNATDPPTIDVAVAEELFTDHTDIVLLTEDIDVQELSDPESDVTERADQIVLLGNDRTTAGGQRVLIKATADVPGGTEYDYNGYPVERTRVQSDGAVDHQDYAVARATDLARQEAEPPLSVTVKLSGDDTRPGIREGDWLYVYHPEAGIEDYRDDNAQVIEGRTVYPRRVRVLEKARSLGPSHYIRMRRSNGTYVQFLQSDGTMGDRLPGVRWSAEDATVLTLGDRLPEWQADPQGKAAGEQYLSDRARRPR